MENQKRPLIGLVPLMDYQRASYWMLPGYMQGVEQAGGVPVMLPPDRGRPGAGPAGRYL